MLFSKRIKEEQHETVRCGRSRIREQGTFVGNAGEISKKTKILSKTIKPENNGLARTSCFGFGD